MLVRAKPCPTCGCGEPTPPTCTIATDDFNRPESATVGGDLTEVTGADNILILSNTLVMVGDTEPEMLVEHSATFPGGKGSITIKFHATINEGGPGFAGVVLGAYTAVDDCVGLLIGASGTDLFIQLIEFDGATETEIMDSATIPGGVGEWITLRLCWTGEVAVVTVTSPVGGGFKRGGLTTKTGGVALRGMNVTQGQISWDDMVLEKIADTSSTCPTCRITVGFAGPVGDAYFTDCFDEDVDLIAGLASDIEAINECNLVFVGHYNGACGDAPIQFDSIDYPALRAWVEGGGRLFVVGEWCDENPFGVGCCSDNDLEMNFFLDDLADAAIVISNALLGTNTDCEADPEVYSAGDANIAQGLTWPGEATSRVSGGTSCFYYLSPSDVTLGVIALGDGFVFVSGDSNFSECGDPCPFLRRVLEYANEDVI